MIPNSLVSGYETARDQHSKSLRVAAIGWFRRVQREQGGIASLDDRATIGARAARTSRTRVCTW